MRRGRTLLFVIVFLLVLGVGGFFAFQMLSGASTAQQQQAEKPTKEVYIAKQPIPQGVAITEEVLGTIKLPQENVIAVMFETNEKAALLGKIAKLDIDQGTPITESMVVDASSAVPITGPKWATSIPPGMTAMSIPTSRLATSAYAINEGAHVNINACFLFMDIDPAFQTLLPNATASLSSTGFLPDTLTALTLGVDPAKGGPQGRVELDPSLQQPYYLIPSETKQRPRMVCQMLLQDVVVMKLGNFSLTNTTGAAPAQPAATPNPQQQQRQQQQQQQPQEEVRRDIITLIVTPQDALTLTYLMYSDAKITMTLRNPGDQARQATEAATLQFLLSQYNIPVPAKLPYTMDAVFSVDALGLEVTAPPDLPGE